MRISDWSSDVCSSDLPGLGIHIGAADDVRDLRRQLLDQRAPAIAHFKAPRHTVKPRRIARPQVFAPGAAFVVGEPAQEIPLVTVAHRSEEHTSELQSLMRTSYAVFCL